MKTKNNDINFKIYMIYVSKKNIIQLYCIKLLLLPNFFLTEQQYTNKTTQKHTHTHLFAQIKGYKLIEL